jgi:hypothetical protein
VTLFQCSLGRAHKTGLTVYLIKEDGEFVVYRYEDTKFDASGQNRSLDIKIDDFDISFGDK